MPEPSLEDCRVLVVEDEYFLAEELRGELEDAGATVLGPVGNIADVLRLIECNREIDGAILDVNLGGELVFPVADQLAERGVPFVLATGYDQSTIPSRYANVTRCGKPLNIRLLKQAIGKVIHA